MGDKPRWLAGRAHEPEGGFLERKAMTRAEGTTIVANDPANLKGELKALGGLQSDTGTTCSPTRG